MQNQSQQPNPEQKASAQKDEILIGLIQKQLLEYKEKSIIADLMLQFIETSNFNHQELLRQIEGLRAELNKYKPNRKGESDGRKKGSGKTKDNL